MATQNTASPAPSNGYGKRPKWQWALIYLVVAVVVYGAIYYFFIRKSGSTGY